MIQSFVLPTLPLLFRSKADPFSTLHWGNVPSGSFRPSQFRFHRRWQMGSTSCRKSHSFQGMYLRCGAPHTTRWGSRSEWYHIVPYPLPAVRWQGGRTNHSFPKCCGYFYPSNSDLRLYRLLLDKFLINQLLPPLPSP